MGKTKSDAKKKKKKSSQLVIRIEAGERDAFVKLCDQMDTSAAREIRRFMREWVATHRPDGEAAPQAEAAPVQEATPQSAPVAAVAEAPAKPVRRKRKVEEAPAT
jgi:hypothetical protein